MLYAVTHAVASGERGPFRLPAHLPSTATLTVTLGGNSTSAYTLTADGFLLLNTAPALATTLVISGTVLGANEVVATTGGGSGSPDISNWIAGGLPRWRRAKARVQTGVADARVLCIGDSTTAGLIVGGGTGQVPKAYPVKLADLLTAKGLPATSQSLFGNKNMGNPASGQDSRITGMTGWGTSSNITLCFRGWQGSGAGVFSFAPPGSFDSVDIGAVTFSGGASSTMTVNIDGGASLGTITMGSANGFSRTSFLAATSLGAHTVNVTHLANTPILQYIDCYRSDKRQVRVYNCGYSSGKIADLITNATGQDCLPLLAHLAPDLTIICIGINDWVAATNLTTWTTNLTTLVTAALVQGDVILVSPMASGSVALATQQAYVDATEAVAVAAGIKCVFVDNFTRIGDHTTANANGFKSDTLHGSDYGYTEFAESLSNYMMAA